MPRKPQKDLLKESMRLLNHWSKRETKQRLKQSVIQKQTAAKIRGTRPFNPKTDRKVTLPSSQK